MNDFKKAERLIKSKIVK